MGIFVPFLISIPFHFTLHTNLCLSLSRTAVSGDSILLRQPHIFLFYTFLCWSPILASPFCIVNELSRSFYKVPFFPHCLHARVCVCFRRCHFLRRMPQTFNFIF